MDLKKKKLYIHTDRQTNESTTFTFTQYSSEEYKSNTLINLN